MKNVYTKRTAARILTILLLALCFTVALPLSAENVGRVYDPGEMLTAAQAAELSALLDELSEANEVELYMATYYADNAADDFYGDDYCHRVRDLEGTDAVLLVVTFEELANTYYYDMYTYGRANTAISQKEVDYILDSYGVYTNIKGGNVAEGVRNFFEMSAKAYDGRVGEPWIKVIGISAILAMIIALAICGGVVYSYKKKKASVDYPLDQYAKLNLTKSNDNFVREYTTRTYCPRSNGNSGGGGSRHGGGGGHRGGR